MQEEVGEYEKNKQARQNLRVPKGVKAFNIQILSKSQAKLFGSLQQEVFYLV